MASRKGNRRRGGIRTVSVMSLCAAVLLAGCSSSDAQDVETLDIMFSFDGVEFPKAGNEVEKTIEKNSNSQLNIKASPSSSYGEKLPVMIASGDLPEALVAGKDPNTVQAIRGGAFWEVGPYLKDYPNLSKIDPIIYKNMSVDGKIYGLPRVRPVARGVYIYRKDWLDKIGMKEPETVEDFYQMLRAFTDDDPDGNGKDDTYGMAARLDPAVNADTCERFPEVFGSPNNWKVKGGTFIPDVQTKEYLEGLKFCKRLYDEKLMNRDFAVMDRSQWEEAFASGKAGVWPDTSNATLRMHERIRKKNPDAEVGVFSLLKGPKGTRIDAGNGTNNIFLFPKSSVETEEELKRILSFFETLAEKPTATLFRWGLEGKHYQKADGKAVPIKGADFQNEVDLPYRLTLGVVEAEVNAIDGKMHPLKEEELELPKENAKYAVHDPATPLVSETYMTNGTQLDTMISDANVKFTMGKIDEAGWEKEVERWWKSGGKQIAEEYAAAYKKLEKK